MQEDESTVQTLQPPSITERTAPSRYGGHSLTGRLRRVVVRPPAPPLGDEWRALGYPRAVDHDRAEREHAAFRALLAEAGAEVIEAGPDAPGELDAIFAYDPSIITDAGAVLLRMGKPERLGEAALAESVYGDLGVPILGRIEAPGTVDGGDTLWLDARTLAVGRGYRTNDGGIAQLAAILGGIGVAVMPVALPHWHGPAECLHLMSLVSPVAPDLAVVYPPLLATAFVEELGARGWGFVEVPDAEFETLGCNVLALAPRRCLVAAGNPVTRSRLEATGCDVVAYEGDEISINRAGGPTCLTRPLWREAI